jgi:hypothetical protein
MQGMRLLNCTLQSAAGPAAAVAIAAVDPTMHHSITANFTALTAAAPLAISLALDENSTLKKPKLKTADKEEEKPSPTKTPKTQLRSVVSFWNSRKEKRKKCKTEVQDWSQEKTDLKDPAMNGRDFPR